MKAPEPLHNGSGVLDFTYSNLPCYVIIISSRIFSGMWELIMGRSSGESKSKINIVKKKLVVSGVAALLMSTFLTFLIPVASATTVVDEEHNEKFTHETNIAAVDGFDRYAITYHIFITGVPGPNVALIGGVHGSERAGSEAAQYIVDNFDFPSGNFLIIPKATPTAPNEWGPGGQNLNRSFPGNPNGNAAQRVAAAITQLLDDFSPCVIIDFHEAYQDGFSNKILYWPDHEVTSEKLEAIEFVSDAINQTDLVGRHLGAFGGRDFGPARSKLVRGTTTQEYTLRYNVPVFTTETCMSNRLNVRIDQIVFITDTLFEFYQYRYEAQIIEAKNRALSLERFLTQNFHLD